MTNGLIGLTRKGGSSSLTVMRLARPSIVAVLAFALVASVMDCAALTQQQAMRCCRSMRCSAHHRHSGECCKQMPELRAALGQPATAYSISSTPVVLAVLAVRNDGFCSDESHAVTVLSSHGPPGSFSPPPLTLRI